MIHIHFDYTSEHQRPSWVHFHLDHQNEVTINRLWKLVEMWNHHDRKKRNIAFSIWLPLPSELTFSSQTFCMEPSVFCLHPSLIICNWRSSVIGLLVFAAKMRLFLKFLILSWSLWEDDVYQAIKKNYHFMWPQFLVKLTEADVTCLRCNEPAVLCEYEDDGLWSCRSERDSV